MSEIAIHIDERLAARLKREGFSFSELSHAVEKRVYDFAFEQWKHLGEEEAHIEAAMFCLTHPSHGPLYAPKTPDVAASVDIQANTAPVVDMKPLERLLRVVVYLLTFIALLMLLNLRAHAQHGTSRIDVIKWQQAGSTIGTFAAPFTVNFTGAGVTCSRSGGTVTCTVTGGSITNNPGGSNTQIQYNSAGTAFGGAAVGTYIVGTTKFQFQTGTHFDFNDPTDTTKVVEFDASGLTTATTRTVAFPDANSRTIKNGVTTGQIPIWNASTGTFDVSDPLVQGTQAAASTTIPNPVVDGGSDYGGTPAVRVLKVDSSGQLYFGNFPSSFSVSNFPATQAVSSTQLPAALDGSGFLKVHEQGTPSVNQGTSPWVVSCTAANCTVEVADGSGNKITTNSTTYTAKFAFDTNLLGTLGTAFSTPGKVDVKGADGDVFVRQATGTNLHMVCDSGCSSSAGFADSGAFTAGTTAINPVGGDFDDTPPTAITTGHAAAARITPNRAIHINLRNQAGTEIGTSSNPVRVDPTGTTTQPVSGTVTSNIGTTNGLALDASLTTLDTDVKSNVTLHAGTNLIGKAGFDGTTPGSTNGVTQFQPARTTGTITSAASTVSVATTGYAVATVTVNGTYAGVTINFEFSDDAGTTWYTETCTRTDVSTQENSEALPSNQTRAWDCGVYAATNFRVRASAWTSGTANIGLTLSAASIEPAQTVGVSGTVPVSCASGATCPTNSTLQAGSAIVGKVTTDQTTHGTTDLVAADITKIAGNAVAADANGRQILKTYPDTTTTSYHASAKFAASSTTDNAVMPGNATNTVLVTKVTVTCTETTAGQINVELLKRSTADSAGTSANMTAVPDDANYAAGVSVPKSYTGTGPTIGTVIGDLDNAQVGCMASGTATPNDVYIFRPLKPIVLRGTAQMITVNVGNAALTGGTLTVTFDYMETTTP